MVLLALNLFVFFQVFEPVLSGKCICILFVMSQRSGGSLLLVILMCILHDLPVIIFCHLHPPTVMAAFRMATQVTAGQGDL